MGGALAPGGMGTPSPQGEGGPEEEEE
jgi:hypothetical protein